MRVTVLGKEYVSGTSKKTGRDFEGIRVHVSYEKMFVQGVAVETIWLDPKSYPLTDIVVGAEYNVDRDNRGYLLGFEPVDPKNTPLPF